MMKAIRLARSTLLPPLVQAIRLASRGFILPIAFIYALVYIGVNFGGGISSAGGVVGDAVGNVLAHFAPFFRMLALLVAVPFVVVGHILSSIGPISPLTIIIILLVLILGRLNRMGEG